MAAGLQTQIWNNNLKSLALLAAYPFILCAVVGAGAWLFAASGTGGAPGAGAVALDFVFAYWPLIFTAVGIWFVLSYFWNARMIRKLSHAHSVSREEEPDLYNLLENLCIAEGMPMPRLNIIETHARNAFASGIDRNSYEITVTRGLMRALAKDELEAVLGHELSHILNRDVRLMMICIVFTGMLGFAAQLVWSNLRFSLWTGGTSRRQRGNTAILLLGLSLILWAGYAATLFTRFAVSRRREYMADAGAIRLTKNPGAMMRALLRISGRDAVPAAPADMRWMCIENSRPFLGLFSSHPPIEKRVAAIAQMTGVPVPPLPSAQPAEAAATLSGASPAAQENWATRQRFKSRRANPWT